jgi:hypothetical protein
MTAVRSPAPIQEESPTPAPEQARKLESPRARVAGEKSGSSEANSSTARRFDGTWKGTGVRKEPTGLANRDYVYSSSFTLIIKDGRTADVTMETTATLPTGGWWAFLSKEYRHLSPLYYKATFHADHVVLAGADLVFHWSGGRVTDWTPRTLPLAEVQKLGGTPNFTGVCTLTGAELVCGKIVYHRVK